MFVYFVLEIDTQTQTIFIGKQQFFKTISFDGKDLALPLFLKKKRR